MAALTAASPLSSTFGTTSRSRSNSATSAGQYGSFLHLNKPKMSPFRGSIAEDAPFTTVLDQLHAEQKSTIEALTYQVEFYRQREERYTKELETLRRHVQEVGEKSGGQSDAAAVTRLAMENRLMGDELDALRTKQVRWREERAKLQRHQLDLEQQLQEARHSIAAFSQAVEQLELKIQRRESEGQTRALQLEQDARANALRCEELESQLLRQESIRQECDRLRQQLQSTSDAAAMRQSRDAEQISIQSRQIDELRQQLREAMESRSQRQESEGDLRRTLGEVTDEVTRLRATVDDRERQIGDLTDKLEKTKNLLALREKMVASDSKRMEESKATAQNLSHQVKVLEEEKQSLQRHLDSTNRLLRESKGELDAMRTRQSGKDHAVVVATLRAEIAALKERLRSEFQQEREALTQAKLSLENEVQDLVAQLSDKERIHQRLQDEVAEKDNDTRAKNDEITSLRSTIESLRRDLSASRAKYQELVHARSALVEHLDSGFKELLQDNDAAASAYLRVNELEEEIRRMRGELSSREKEVTGLREDMKRLRIHEEASAKTMRDKIDELYSQLRDREDELIQVREWKLKVTLLEREKSRWHEQTEAIRSDFEREIEVQRDEAKRVYAEVQQLKKEKSELQSRVLALTSENAATAEEVAVLNQVIAAKNSEISGVNDDVKRLQETADQLTTDLSKANRKIDLKNQEQQKREHRLLRERNQLEQQFTQLIQRIEAAQNRNVDLGEKVMQLMKKSKSDDAERVAMSAQIKSEKQKVQQYQRALSTFQRSISRDDSSTDELKRRLVEVTGLKDSYQAELAQLRESLQVALNDREDMHRQRDEAIKRVSMMMSRQNHLKSTAESHTVDLVEEIEALQSQLDDERKRCTILLGNEKTLLRDISEKNGVIAQLEGAVARLQQSVQHFQEQAHERGDQTQSSGPSRVESTKTCHASGYASPPSSTASFSTSSTRELERLLGNLERIAEYSAPSSATTSPR
ncbi:hypothetical protein PINS_up004678 [Pythium insidiosum]|nr:hypothetical protein PINS_up004678 [Pythium insidiosum]